MKLMKPKLVELSNGKKKIIAQQFSDGTIMVRNVNGAMRKFKHTEIKPETKTVDEFISFVK